MCNSSEKDTNVLYEKLKKVIDEKKQLTNPLIEILHQAQEIFGYLPVEVQQYVATELGVPVSQVYGVVTFYNFFSMKPRGKHIINVCTGTACFVKGAPRILQMISDELGIEIGDTTQDNQFSLSAVRCVGACSLAPVFVIDEQTFGRIDNRERLNEIINQFKD